MNSIHTLLKRNFIKMMEAGILPDYLIRLGIRSTCKGRLRELKRKKIEDEQIEKMKYVDELKKLPLAVFTQSANEQHYELPAAFFDYVLGVNKKYSSAYFTENDTLNEAEERALELTCEHAEIMQGQNILELGCGWGSLSLYMAAKYYDSNVIALSNSNSQREYIEKKAIERGLNNLKVITRNIVDVESLQDEFGAFDRVVSVEMFEHLKNYEKLFENISKWLKPGGKLFTHVFSHKDFAYAFETEGEDNWMGRYFFTGGQMPSQDLFLYFSKHLTIENVWCWDGVHYQITSEEWLKNLDANRPVLLPILEKVYGVAQANIWFQRWRVFFMACAELFGYNQGREWGVSHYRFVKR